MDNKNLSKSTYCASYACSNAKYKKDCRNKSFFLFPLKDSKLLKIWLQNIQRQNFIPSPYSVLCSDHFEESCFAYQNFTNRRSLKRNSVPTIFSFSKQPRNSRKILNPSVTSSTDYCVEIQNQEECSSDYCVEIQNQEESFTSTAEHFSKYAGSVEDALLLPSYDNIKTTLYSARGSATPILHQSIDDSKDGVAPDAQESAVKPRPKSGNQRMKEELAKISSEKQKERISRLSGRRVVDIAFFIQQIQEISDHGRGCTFKDMVFVYETPRGFNSGFKFSCRKCSLTKQIWTNSNPESKQQASVNAAAVSAIIGIGGGRRRLKKFTDALDLPCLSTACYNKELGLTDKELIQVEDKAKKNMALDTAIMVDRAWSMVSYGDNLQSLSGENLRTDVVPEPKTHLVMELEPNSLLRPVEPIDMIVEMDPSAIITHDIDPPDISEPGPSSRIEPDSSMMELDKAMTCQIYPADAPQPDLLPQIKKEPVDPDTYKQDILSGTVVQENSFSNESSITSNREGSLFHPPVLIKEELVTSEEEL